MKKLILTLAIAIALTSCSTEPIEMREVNPTQGINESAKLFFEYRSDKVVLINKDKPLNIQYNPTTRVLTLNTTQFEGTVVGNTITYTDKGIDMVIEFNAGYVYQDDKTRTKFEIYKANDFKLRERKDMDVYVYKN
jgi:hypothetical protein